MNTQAYLDERFPNAVFRYRITIATSALCALWIYVLTVKYSPLVLNSFKDEIVQLANIVGHQAAKILILVTVLVITLPFPVLVQFLVVQFASKNLLLHCPHCGVFVATRDSIEAVRKYGTCPTCEEYLIPDDEIGVEPFEQSRLPIFD